MMWTGLLVLMIDKAPVDSMSTSEPISYHGHPLSNELSLIKVVSNMNIKDVGKNNTIPYLPDL